MSGISGIFNIDGQDVDRTIIQKMTAAIARRGPDEEGLWVQGPVGFGHRQLWTTPEAKSEHQPIALDDGNYVITCDGRVDNRRELIKALQAEGPVSTETSDAELLLRLYMARGPDGMRRVVGDFAFVIWDGPLQQLFCARDPMGIRTFYYYHDDNRFIFASDISAIIAGSGIQKNINELMVGLYLLNKHTEAEQTFFQGVFQVLPANHIVVSKQGIQKQVYWEPCPWDQISYKKNDEYVEHFREVFYESVACRLRSTSPVGVTLSGGLDSTSIACTAAHLIKQGQATGIELLAFSSVFKDFPVADEGTLIQKVLESSGIRGQLIYGDEQWGFKPLRDNSMVGNRPYPVPFQARHEARLSCARASGVRTIMTGEGGDEFFNLGFGYFMDLLKDFRWARLREELRFVTPETREGFRNSAVKFYKKAALDLAPGPVQRMYRRLRPDKWPPWLSDDFIRRSGAWQYEPIQLTRPKSRSLYRQSQYSGPIGLPRLPFLQYITETYAYNNVEVRHPFLDLRTVEFLIRIPPHLKFRRGLSKLLLRQAMEGLVPDAVRLRVTKSHFADVLIHGLREERARILDTLENGYLIGSGWIKKQDSMSLIDRVLDGERGLAGRLISLVTLEEWLGQYFGSNGSGVLSRERYLAPDVGQ